MIFSRKGKKNRFRKPLGIAEGYKRYKKESKHPVDSKEYRRILNAYLDNAKQFILDGGDFKLAGGLGSMRVVKSKMDFKKKKVDWGRTKQLWIDEPEEAEKKTLVYFLNEHSSYNYYRFLWKKGWCSNISYITFIPNRLFKKGLTDMIKDKNKDYLKRTW